MLIYLPTFLDWNIDIDKTPVYRTALLNIVMYFFNIYKY